MQSVFRSRHNLTNGIFQEFTKRLVWGLLEPTGLQLQVRLPVTNDLVAMDPIYVLLPVYHWNHEASIRQHSP